MYVFSMYFPDGSDGKESPCDAGDLGLIPWSWRSHGKRIGYPLQCSCLENSMDRRAWWATVHEIPESDTPERLTLSLDFIYLYIHKHLHIPIHIYTHKPTHIFNLYANLNVIIIFSYQMKIVKLKEVSCL